MTIDSQALLQQIKARQVSGETSSSELELMKLIIEKELRKAFAIQKKKNEKNKK
jgi:hypothetical protein